MLHTFLGVIALGTDIEHMKKLERRLVPQTAQDMPVPVDVPGV